MPLVTSEKRFDTQFEGDLHVLEEAIALIRRKPRLIIGYKKTYFMLQKAKVLLFSLERFELIPCIEGGDRLLELAEEVVLLVEAAQVRPVYLEELEILQKGIKRHRNEIAKHLNRGS